MFKNIVLLNELKNLQLFFKNGIIGVIINAKPVDKTLVNFGKGTHNKLKKDKKYCLSRVSVKIREGFALLGKM